MALHEGKTMETPVEWNNSESGVPRILVVDDDCAIRSLLRESFEDCGFVVEEASNGPQALIQVRAFQPDLLLLDVVMPEMDGFETCGRIHELSGFERVPVLMMTALDDVEYINRAYDSGAADVVSKPLNWVSLIHRVRQLIETARVTQQLHEAEARDRAKSEYLAVVSHELRSPLNTIMGHTALMLEAVLGDLTQKQLASLRRIRRSAREVLELTFSILDLTRLEAATLPVEYQEVSLPEVLREIRDDMETTHGTSDIDLIWRVDDNLQALHTDRAKIKMVIRNLINNAVKFTPTGSVTVDARLSDGGVQVCVTDTGVGIPVDKQQLIFEPFESMCGDASGYESTGLGLYVVKRFIEVLDADIQVESVPGKGTSFTVSLATKH